MAKFNWGKVIETFDYNFDGDAMTVTKFHPWKREGSAVLSGVPDATVVQFHCEELHESSDSILGLIISWIANKKLGLNQYALVAGCCRALGINA